MENQELIMNLLQIVDGLERAMRDNATVEALAVLCDHNLNLYVELGKGIKGIIKKEDIL